MCSKHTRIPVILHPKDYDPWISREMTEQPPIDLLRTFDSEDMAMQPANPVVGNVNNYEPNDEQRESLGSFPQNVLKTRGDSLCTNTFGRLDIIRELYLLTHSLTLR